MNYSVIALLCLFSSCACSADIKPLAFVGIKSGSADYTAICDVMKKYCDKDKTTKIWKVKNKPNELYLITPSLNLVKVKSEMVTIRRFRHGILTITLKMWKFLMKLMICP